MLRLEREFSQISLSCRKSRQALGQFASSSILETIAVEEKSRIQRFILIKQVAEDSYEAI